MCNFLFLVPLINRKLIRCKICIFVFRELQILGMPDSSASVMTITVQGSKCRCAEVKIFKLFYVD